MRARYGDHAKSAVKAVTWRCIGAVDTFILAFVVTGHLGAAGSIMGAEVFTKSFLYYAHERAWSLHYLSHLFGGSGHA